MHVWPGADGVTIAGDSWGEPSGPQVILLHGAGQTRHAWRGTGRLLGAAGYHVLSLDARGHGDSGWAGDGDYSRDAMIRDLRSVVSALGDRRPALVGASMGGTVGLLAVGEGHLEASALILIDLAPRTEASGVNRVRSFMAQRPEGFGSLEEVAEAIRSYQPDRPQQRSLDGLAKNVRLGPDGRYYWHWDPRFMAKPVLTVERRVEAARRLAVPTLIVRGRYSDVVSEENVREFLALCPHAEYADVAEAGHMVTGDRNDAFGRAMLAFLRRNLPTGERSPPPER
jgi:non-heme chloroperoxidase